MQGRVRATVQLHARLFRTDLLLLLQLYDCTRLQQALQHGTNPTGWAARVASFRHGQMSSRMCCPPTAGVLSRRPENNKAESGEF